MNRESIICSLVNPHLVPVEYPHTENWGTVFQFTTTSAAAVVQASCLGETSHIKHYMIHVICRHTHVCTDIDAHTLIY